MPTETFAHRFQVAVMATLTNGQDCDLTDSQPIVKIGQPQRSNRQPMANRYLMFCGREAGKPGNRRSTASASDKVNTCFVLSHQGLQYTHLHRIASCVQSLAFVPPRAFAGRARSGGAPHQQPVGHTVGQPRQSPEAATQHVGGG